MRLVVIRILALCMSLYASGLMGQVVINEFMADNLTTIADPDNGKFGDWIELYNTSSSSIDISAYALTDDPTILDKWIFPSGTEIPGSGYLIVWADNDNSGLHTSFRLGKSGETIVLSDKSLGLVDTFTYSEQIEDVSYGRVNDGGDQWAFFTLPSPGSSNSAGSGDYVAALPEFSHESGFYTGTQHIILGSQSPEAQIFYTLDGSIPTYNSKLYSGPVSIDTTSVIRAIQVEEGYLYSPIATRTYLLNEETTLPVFSIVTDPPNLWDLDSGIYVEGRDYVWGWGNGNFWQDWERPCFVEFWEADRDLKISQGAALKIGGALTRTQSQKSLRLIAKSEYGKKKLSYRFFKDKSISAFNDIVLRSSGNDWGRTMMADGMMATIVANQMDIDYQAYRPAILFLNGQYWGIHNIREKIGDDYIEENHSFDKDNLDLLSQLSDIREGDREAYNELMSFIQNNDLNVSENFQYVEDHMDVQEFLNYYVAQTFYANIDWPAGNIKYWRPRQEPSQWRWILFDTDLAYQSFWTNSIEQIIDPEPFYEGTNDFFLGLLQSDEFKTRFLNTYQYHMATTFKPERLVRIIDSLAGAIEPEMERHIQRWKGYHGWTFTNADGVYTEKPDLASYSEWLSNVDAFRLFSRNRADYLNQYVAEYYGFGENVEVSIAIDPIESGKIWVNHDKATTSFMDMVFFKDQKITLEPLGTINLTFDEWKIETGFTTEAGLVSIIDKESEWKFLDKGVYPGATWTTTAFDDSDWEAGQGPLGYNFAPANTRVDFGGDAGNKHISYWFRHQFNISSAENWQNLTVEILRDDGAIIWLNGVEILRSNMAEDADYNSTALTGVDASDETKYFQFEFSSNLLVDGVNTIAVEVHQISKTSSDMSFDLALSGLTNKSVGDITIVSDPLITQNILENTQFTASFVSRDEPVVLKINELMSDNQGLVTTPYGKTPDWIEIYNPNDFDVDMGGLYITDNLLEPDKYRISTDNPELTTVKAKGFQLLIADGDRLFNSQYVDIQLSTNGEEVGLYEKLNGEFYLIDSLFFPPLMPNSSFGRIPDGSDNWTTFNQIPSPGEANRRSTQVIPNRNVALLQNYPNPFKEETTILFNVKTPTQVKIDIVDMHGRLVKQITNREWTEGLHEIVWNASNNFNARLQPGVYLCVLFTGTFYQSNKMIIIR